MLLGVRACVCLRSRVRVGVGVRVRLVQLGVYSYTCMCVCMREITHPSTHRWLLAWFPSLASRSVRVTVGRVPYMWFGASHYT